MSGQDHVNTGGKLVASAGHYEEARCAMPACGEPLNIVWTASRAIYLDDTRGMLSNPSGATSATWHVECSAGHIVLLPGDTADDYYTFAGACVCNPDYPDTEAEQLCPHNDMDRLRLVITERRAAS